MDKIRALLEKCGVKAELCQQICEAIDNYANALKQKNSEEFAAKVEAAKKVCIEEVETSKAELARRLQIFCEAKVAFVEQLLTKHATAKNTEAVETLEHVKGLLEGIQVADETGLRKQIEQLQQKLTTATEERNKAVEKANRQTKLAESVLKRNRTIEHRLATTERQSDRESLEESVNRGKPKVQQPLDAGREGGIAQTTRRTLRENQDPRLLRANQKQPVTTTKSNGALSPEQIAANMEEGAPL